MALTQHRPHGAIAGKRFGAFSGKTPGDIGHPVGRLTQNRPHSAIAGKRFGSFADKGGAEIPWEMAPAIPMDVTATVGISGDFAFTAPTSLSLDSVTLSLSAAVSISGDFSFSDAPLVPPEGGPPGARFGDDDVQMRNKQIIQIVTALLASGVLH